MSLNTGPSVRSYDRPEPYLKIPDNLIHVLPHWEFSSTGRAEFIDAFNRMIRTIGGQFMLTSVVCKNPTPPAAPPEQRQGGATIFSPTPRPLATPAHSRSGYAPRPAASGGWTTPDVHQPC